MQFTRRKRHPPARGCISSSRRTPSIRTLAGGAGPAALATKTRRSCCQVPELSLTTLVMSCTPMPHWLLEHVGDGAQGPSLARARVTSQTLEAPQKFDAGAAAATMPLMTASTCQRRRPKGLVAQQPSSSSSSNSSSSRVRSRAGAAAGRRQPRQRSWRGSCTRRRRRSLSCRPALQQIRQQRSRPPLRTRKLHICATSKAALMPASCCTGYLPSDLCMECSLTPVWARVLQAGGGVAAPGGSRSTERGAGGQGAARCRRGRAPSHQVSVPTSVPLLVAMSRHMSERGSEHQLDGSGGAAGGSHMAQQILCSLIPSCAPQEPDGAAGGAGPEAGQPAHGAAGGRAAGGVAAAAAAGRLPPGVADRHPQRQRARRCEPCTPGIICAAFSDAMCLHSVVKPFV